MAKNNKKANKSESKNFSDINKELVAIRERSRNPDSRMNVAAILSFRTPDGELHYESAANTEISRMPDSNMCAERNALRYTRGRHGHDFGLEDIYIMGGDQDEKLDPENPKHISCCGACLDELQQFADYDETKVHLIPVNDGSKKQEIIAQKHIYTNVFGELVAPVFRYNSERSYQSERLYQANGILVNSKKGKEVSIERLQTQLKKLVPDFEVKLNEDITNYIKVVSKGAAAPDLREMQNLLSIMRSLTYYEMTTTGKLEPADISRIDAAIIGAGDRYYSAVSCESGSKVSRQPTAVMKALTYASGFISKKSDNRVHSLYLMGDPLVNLRMKQEGEELPDRLYPFLPEVYKLSKQSTYTYDAQGNKSPDTQVFCFAPITPLKEVSLDLRPTNAKLTSSPKPNVVSQFLLHQLTPGAKLFIGGAKHQEDMGHVERLGSSGKIANGRG